MKEWLLNPWVAGVGSGVVVAIIVATLTGLRKPLARFFRETIPHLWGVFRIQIRKRFARHRKPMILITCFAKEGTENSRRLGPSLRGPRSSLKKKDDQRTRRKPGNSWKDCRGKDVPFMGTHKRCPYIFGSLTITLHSAPLSWNLLSPANPIRS